MTRNDPSKRMNIATALYIMHNMMNANVDYKYINLANYSIEQDISDIYNESDSTITIDTIDDSFPEIHVKKHEEEKKGEEEEEDDSQISMSN